MHRSNRRQRIFSLVLYFGLFYWLVFLIQKSYILPQPPLIYGNGDITFSVNVYTKDTQLFWRGINLERNITNPLISSLFQSKELIIPVYLNYIEISDDAGREEYCFTKFDISKSAKIPFGIFTELETDTSIGLIEPTGEYVLSNPLCLQKGEKYFLPDIFLGFTTSQPYANFIFGRINDERAFEFFPFDEQKITLNLAAEYKDQQGTFRMLPDVEVFIPESGWVGNIFRAPDERLSIHLQRPAFYRVIFILSTVILLLVVSTLRRAVNLAGGYFEVMFGLLVGLLPLYDILIPDFITGSIPIDVAVYILYMIILMEIVTASTEGSIRESSIALRNLRITGIFNTENNHKYVVLENKGLFSINLKEWTLSDEQGILVKFPDLILRGRSIFSNNRGLLFTGNIAADLADARELGGLYISWDQQRAIQTGSGTIYLRDAKGELVHSRPYSFEAISEPPQNENDAGTAKALPDSTYQRPVKREMMNGLLALSLVLLIHHWWVRRNQPKTPVVRK